MAPISHSALSESLAGSPTQRHPTEDPARGLTPDPRQNRLLASLPEVDWQRWRSQLEPVAHSLGQVLHESGAMLRQAYFPTSAIASLVHVSASGHTAEYDRLLPEHFLT
jgi:hypothetical protein